MLLAILDHLFRLLGFYPRRLGFLKPAQPAEQPLDTQAESFAPRSEDQSQMAIALPPLPKEASLPVVLKMTIAATCNRDFGTWTCVLMTGSDSKELAGTDTITTKERLELTAAIAGLTALKRRCGVELYTDSPYLLQAAALFPVWKFNPKHQMRNQALWDELYAVAARHDIQWHGPRARHEADFALVMTETTSEFQGRTKGTGSDVSYLYAGTTSPWCASLDKFRAFTDDEILEDSVCSHISADDMPPTTTITKQARESLIARVARASSSPRFTRDVPLNTNPPTTSLQIAV